MRFSVIIILLFLTWLMLYSWTYAEDQIIWASRVVDVSSQMSYKKYSARQALGKPSVTPEFGYSECSWTPVINKSNQDHWIHVEFDSLIRPEMLVINENYNPGQIKAISLFDIDGSEFRIDNIPKATGESGRTLNLSFPIPANPIISLKLWLHTTQPSKYFQIDAIGLSKSNKRYNVVPDLAGDTDFIGTPEKLPDAINSPDSELTPVITQDGNTLFFTRQYQGKDNPKQKDQDIWYANKERSLTNSEDEFIKSDSLNYPINGNLANFIIGITPDQNQLIVGGSYLNQYGKYQTGMHLSSKAGSGWSIPNFISILEYDNKNRFSYYFLSSNMKVLILGMENNESEGDMDIYVSFLENKRFTKPKSLGPVINTPAQEGTAFLASDMKTLYFSSSGHPGYGNIDIFVTTRLDDTWQNWSEPKNIGKPINDEGWNAYLTIPAKGDYAYYVSSNSNTLEDIYRIKLPESIKPKPVLLIKGRVLNKKTNEPIGAIIKYELLPSGEESGIAASNSNDGKYQIALPAGEKYGFLAESEGFISINENLDLRDIVQYEELEKDLYLVPIEKGQTIRLNNIFFNTGDYKLLEDSYSELNRLSEFLNKYPKIRLIIEGHTDNVGSPAFNLTLSENRANSVKDYLTSTTGITPDRIKVKGFGETKPISSNSSEEGRKLNRRVEFQILE